MDRHPGVRAPGTFGWIAAVVVSIVLAHDVAAQRGVLPSRSVLFADDFRSLSRWRIDGPRVWTIRNGYANAEMPNEKQEKSFLFAGSPAWRDYSVSVRVR